MEGGGGVDSCVCVLTNRSSRHTSRVGTHHPFLFLRPIVPSIRPKKARIQSDTMNRQGNDDDDGGGGNPAVVAVAAQRRRRQQRRRLQIQSLVPRLVEVEEGAQGLAERARYNRDVLVDGTSYYAQPAHLRQRFSGDMRLEALFDCLACFDQTEFRRSNEQREMHILWAQACIPQIYGSAEFAARLPDILRRFGVSALWTFIAIFATRRFGKTFGMAQFIAALIWTQHKSVVNVFSMAKVSSDAMAEKILMMLEVIRPPGYDLQLERNKTTGRLSIVNPMGIRSTVYAYPCSEIRSPPSPPPLFLSVVACGRACALLLLLLLLLLSSSSCIFRKIKKM